MSNICPCTTAKNTKKFQIYEERGGCGCVSPRHFEAVCKLCGRCLETVKCCKHKFE